MICSERFNIHVVTARKNQPSSYRFTQANQRNSWTVLDWTSQISLKVAFSSENKLEVYLLNINHQSIKVTHYSIINMFTMSLD